MKNLQAEQECSALLYGSRNSPFPALKLETGLFLGGMVISGADAVYS